MDLVLDFFSSFIKFCVFKWSYRKLLKVVEKMKTQLSLVIEKF